MIDRVVLISLEPWDDTWRRNQHLASRLVKLQHVRHIVWVSSPERGLREHVSHPEQGIEVVTPPLIAPRRIGGLALTAGWLRRRLSHCDVLWINDPRLGVACLQRRTPAVYDVTDDWRAYPFPERIRRRIVEAEDRLAITATTVVCSHVLADRWVNRYSCRAQVVQNGVDLTAHRDAGRVPLEGPGPHIGYVGTLQPERLDIPLVLQMAALPKAGTVHLIGPDALGDAARSLLEAAPGVRLHRPVPASRVPSVMASMDVLVAPHLVNDFTLSLDAIKAYEYAASGRPVVATPTSGFQRLPTEAGVQVGDRTSFLRLLEASLDDPDKRRASPVPGSTWEERTEQFAGVLQQVAVGQQRRR